MPANLEISVSAELPELQKLLGKLSGARLTGALKNIGEAAVPLARDSFQEGENPYGEAWDPLKGSTLEAFVGKSRKRRRAYGTKPLVRTSALVNSLNWRLVGGDTVAVGASQAYGKYHQGDPDVASKGIVPQRAFLPIASRGLPDAWREELIDAVDSYLAIGGE